MFPDSPLVGPFQFVGSDKALELKRNAAHPGDIVATNQGTVGQVSIVPAGPYDRYVVSQRQLRLRVRPDVACAQFVVAILRGQAVQAELASQTIRTGVSHINLRIFGDLRVPLPPLERQHALAQRYAAANDVARTAREVAYPLRSLRAALLTDLLSGDHEIPAAYDRFLDPVA